MTSLLKTRYQLKSKDEQAPLVTNCVTAVRYFLSHYASLPLPKVFIGDLPRILFRMGCSLQQIKISEMKLGDLLFFKNPSMQWPCSKRQYITHVAIALGPTQIFHSTIYRGGGQREDLVKPTSLYAKNLVNRVIDEPFLFLRYIDPRNQKLREAIKDELLPFPIYKPPPEIEIRKLCKRFSENRSHKKHLFKISISCDCKNKKEHLIL